VSFPRESGGGITTQHESVIVVRPGSSFSLLEATTWGSLFYATEIELERKDAYLGIHVFHFVGQLLVFLEHAGRVLTGLGYGGPLHIVMRMRAIRGVPWIYFQDGFPVTGPASMLDDRVEFSWSSTEPELTDKRDAVAIELLRVVLFSTNWPSSTEQVTLQAYIRGGYKYNSWGEAGKLRL
jgi:hypothetical protein